MESIINLALMIAGIFCMAFILPAIGFLTCALIEKIRVALGYEPTTFGRRR